MAWTAPTGANDNIDVWSLFEEANPGQARTAENFRNWWSNGGQEAVADAYNSNWQQWADLETQVLQNQPDAINFDDIMAGQNTQLYGGVDDPNTPQDESAGGIYDFMQALQDEMAAGAAQYQNAWSQSYATNAGFGTPEERDAWLKQQRDLQAMFQQGMQDPTLSAEQQKAVRAQRVEAEAQARKQAEAMFQETGSYAVLQRASDELNRANVNDAFKQTLELERENFARALSGVNQQTEIIMREVESGEKSFAYYVEAKQRGVAAALQGWQDRASMVLQETQQKIGVRQQEYDNEMAAWQAEADAIHRAAVLAMGGEKDVNDFLSETYDLYMVPLLQAEEAAQEAAAAQSAADQSARTTGFSIFAIIIGVGLIASGVGAGWGAAVLGAGLNGLLGGGSGNFFQNILKMSPATAASNPSSGPGSGSTEFSQNY